MADLVLSRSIPDCVGFLRKSARGDLIAAVAGILMLPLMLVVFSSSPQRPYSQELTALLLLLGLSFGGSLYAASRANVSVVPLLCVAPSAARMGARIGTVVFLIGGGMVLLSNVVRNLWLGVAPGDFGWRLSTVSMSIGIFFTILPTVAAGVLGAVVYFAPQGILVRQRCKVGAVEDPQRPKGTLILASVASFIICLLSPTVLAVLANRPLPKVVESEAPKKPTQGTSFSYTPPSELSSAEGRRWRIGSDRRLGELVSGASAAFSPDGGLLAYTNRKDSSLVIHDVHSDQERQRFTASRPIEALVWSADGKRIFCASTFEAEPFWMLSLEDKRLVRLPLQSQASTDLMKWERDNEVRLYQNDRLAAVVNLDALTITMEPDSDDDSGKPLITDPFPSTSRCSLRASPRLENLESPIANGSRRWKFQSEAAIFVVDRRTDCAAPLAGPIVPGTDILVASDCSKILTISSEGATMSYVELEEEKPRNGFKVSLSKDASDAFEELTSIRYRVAAFVFAPRKNPLNQNVVGPDTSRVKSLVFMHSLDNGVAVFDQAEGYWPVEKDDVIGCLHHWRGGRPVLLTGREVENWWSAFESASLTAEPKNVAARDWYYAKFITSTAGFKYLGNRQPTTDPSEPVQNPFLVPAGVAPGKAKAQTGPERAAAMEQPALPSGEARQIDAVSQFVRAHHAHVAKYDIESFVSDYASSVEINGKRGVTPDTIRKDQADYMPRYDSLSETILGPVDITRTETGWRATYTIRAYAVVKRDGRVSDRKVALTMDLHETPDGKLEIVRERAAPAQ